MNIIEHLEELAAARAGGGPSEPNYDPELLMVMHGAADCMKDMLGLLRRVENHFRPRIEDEPGSIFLEITAAIAKVEGASIE